MNTENKLMAEQIAEIAARDAEYIDPLPDRLNHHVNGPAVRDRRALLSHLQSLQPVVSEGRGDAQHKLAQLLLNIGWDCPNDAQFRNLRDALPEIAACLRCEVKAVEGEKCSCYTEPAEIYGVQQCRKCYRIADFKAEQEAALRPSPSVETETAGEKAWHNRHDLDFVRYKSGAISEKCPKCSRHSPECASPGSCHYDQRPPLRDEVKEEVVPPLLIERLRRVSANTPGASLTINDAIDALSRLSRSPKAEWQPIRTDRDPPDGGSETYVLAWLVHGPTPANWFQRSAKVVREHPETYPVWLPWPAPYQKERER